MAREVSSKILEGINDLVILAPIKDGFIHAFDNITYATRLRIVAQALNDIRATAREYEKPSPFADASERILSLLDFRVGVLDQDLYQLAPDGLRSRRYMYLIATFDGVWEPYMRLIWRPLGPLLDLLLCNCEGYVRATQNSCADYLAWVRKSQIDSAVFFTTTGLTVSDQVYARKLELLSRGGASDVVIADMRMPDPGTEAARLRQSSVVEMRRANRLAMEALGVLYRLSDYYPPLAADYRLDAGYEREDGLLLQAAHTILDGWQHQPLLDPVLLPKMLESERVPEPQRAAVAAKMAEGFKARFWPMLRWYDGGERPPTGLPDGPTDPVLDRGGVQSGILRAQGRADRPTTHGALLMFTATHSERARAFIAALDIAYEAGGEIPPDGLFRTIGFTRDGLERLGIERGVVRRFPKAFREGMAARASAMGDHWDNHPGNWQLPQRYGADSATPPVEMGEVDFVIQLRCAPQPGEDGAAVVAAEVARIASIADGAVLAACEPMNADFIAAGGGPANFRDHFGLVDGISQPALPDESGLERDRAALGDIVCGYRSSLLDVPPSTPGDADTLQVDGSYLVIRKLHQDVGEWQRFIAQGADAANDLSPELLAAKLVGRYPDGTPVVPTGPGGANDFDYSADVDGRLCPLGAHIRRANPREVALGRPSPRMVRRGMSYGPPWTGTEDGADRGLMFMAYNANIADQFETVQRWLNGGNSTGIAAAANDPLTGVLPRPADGHCFRFVHDGKVVRRTIAKPFVTLRWGLYLFVPSRAALARITQLKRPYYPLEKARGPSGEAMLERLEALPEATAQQEWKRLLEDYDAKDPGEQDRTRDLAWAICANKGGAHRFGDGPRACDGTDALSPTTVVASRAKVMEVLGDADSFGTDVQLARLKAGCGAIYVAEHPDESYRHDSGPTNAIMMAQSPAFAYDSGYRAAASVLAPLIAAGEANFQLFGQQRRDRFFKMEVRREFLAPALANLCRDWFGLPDGTFLKEGHWDWTPVAERGDGAARCPADIYAISRHAFYPRPGTVVEAIARDHGAGVYAAVLAHVLAHRENAAVPGMLAAPMFAAHRDDPDLLTRNILGMLVAAIPPMDGNLRGILADWLGERSLWRHQAALRRAAKGKPADHGAAMAALELPIARAMCKRPSPDLLHRNARADYVLDRPGTAGGPVCGKSGDMLVLSLVSATQRAVEDPGSDGHESQDRIDRRTLDAIPVIFGGDRYQPGHPPHACPGRTLAMGAMTGMLAALLDCGRIEAQPAGLILKISGWPAPPPPA